LPEVTLVFNYKLTHSTTKNESKHVSFGLHVICSSWL